jgi:ubiquinone/menaquinone biosynthesis C-methylase UbiE
MNDECKKPTCSEVAEYEKGATGKQHPREKSSESLLDQTSILSNLEIVPGQTILDAGCGNGYMSKEFSRALGNTGKVYALDPDEVAIATLREETEGTNIEAIVGDITKTTQLPESMLDIVYLSNVFHGFSSEQIKGFEIEVKRILKPHGKLAIAEIVKRDTPFGPPLNMRFSPEELKQVLSLAPLVTVDVGEYFYMQLFENRTGV